MVFLVFDLERCILHLSNAGHNPLVYYNHQQKTCECIECKGCALNLTARATYTVVELPLHSNDIFFIYTDGVTEAVNDQMEMFQEIRLIQGIQEIAAAQSSEIIDFLKSRKNCPNQERKK